MAPPPLDLQNDLPLVERWKVAIGEVDGFVEVSRLTGRVYVAGFLLQSVVDVAALPYMLWPVENKIVTRVDTGKTGTCRVCVYTPRRRVRPRGVVVHLHGGGWTMGRPDLEMRVCRYLCEEVGVVVVAPDYRKAPQYPYPHALEQCYGVLEWISNGGLNYALGGIKVDVSQLALSGASAGSNLAASLMLLTLSRPLPRMAKIVSLGLLYPVLNLDVPYKVKLARVNRQRVLPPWMSRLFGRAYLPPPRTASDPYVSPALADAGMLALFPTMAILTAEYDTLAHEGDEFAHALEKLGVRVVHKRFALVGHGFDQTPTMSRRQKRLNEGATGEAYEMMAGVFRETLVGVLKN